MLVTALGQDTVKMTGFRPTVRTVSFMADSHAGTVSDRCLDGDVLTLDAHLAAAARRVEWSRCAAPVAAWDPTRLDADADDVVEVIVGAAFVSMQQLRIALRLTLDSTQQTQFSFRIVERACASGASRAAVGASALLLDTVRHGALEDAVTMARNAVSVLGAAELLDGSAALVASLSVEISELLDVSPAVVSSEIVRLVAGLPAGPAVPTPGRRRLVELAACG